MRLALSTFHSLIEICQLSVLLMVFETCLLLPAALLSPRLRLHLTLPRRHRALSSLRLGLRTIFRLCALSSLRLGL